jgi:hypothetical protein
MLWIGPELGPLERACIISSVRVGNRVVLWTYAPVAGVPDGVEVKDAREVLDATQVFRTRSGSYAVFADRFRFELLRRGLGAWVDADVYFVRPLETELSYVFGWERIEKRPMIGTAVLMLPEDSPVVASVLEAFEGRMVPWWFREDERRTASDMIDLEGRLDFSELKWGLVGGPEAFTRLAAKHALTCFAEPEPVFYPVHWRRADWLLDPERPLESVVRPETVAIHLWNEVIRKYKNDPAPEGSFLARLKAEGASFDLAENAVRA